MFFDNIVDEITTEGIEKYSVIRFRTKNGFYIVFITKLGSILFSQDVSRDFDIFEIGDVKIPVCIIDAIKK